MLTGEEDSSSLLPAAKRSHKLSPAMYYKPAVEAPPTPPPTSAVPYSVSSVGSTTKLYKLFSKYRSQLFSSLPVQ